MNKTSKQCNVCMFEQDFIDISWGSVCLFVCMYQCGEEERTLRHYWYTSWPDQKTPDKAPPLLELVQQVEAAREEAPPSSGPIIVHCRYNNKTSFNEVTMYI